MGKVNVNNIGLDIKRNVVLSVFDFVLFRFVGFF